MRRTLFVNVIGRCNLDCQRCYLHESTRSDKELLRAETLSDFLRDPIIQRADGLCIWQGGEITLAPVERLYALSDCLRTISPQYHETAVTNCLSTTPSHIEFFRERCNAHIDSTFAMRHKRVKGGSHREYLQAFARCVERYYSAGVSVSVNIELNREMVELGADAFIAYAMTLPPVNWEFDFSIDFKSYLQQPSYSRLGTPVLPLTSSYADFWSYVDQIESRYEVLKGRGHTIGFFEADDYSANTQFGAGCAGEFFTLNVDGSVTTNPLYSDIRGAQIRNEGSQEPLANSELYKNLIAEEYKRRSDCVQCEFYRGCMGGPAHVPVTDGTGECAGGYRFRQSRRSDGERLAL